MSRLFSPRKKIGAVLTALVVALSSGVAFAGAYAANTQHTATTTRVPAPVVHPVPSPSPAILLGPTGRPLPPLPPMPSGKSHFRRVKSATGACIAITGTNPGCAETTNANEVFATTSSITWEAEDLIGSPHQDYYAAPTTGDLSTTANLVAAGGSYTTANGTAHTINAPLTNGIYTLASLNTTTNTWDAIAYVLVGSPPTIETYTDGTLSTKTQTYTTNATGGGVTVYVAATVLDTTDTYMVGIEDQLTGQCVDTAPASTQPAYSAGNYHLCNLSTTAGTGAVPNNNGLILANWQVQLGTSPLPPEGGTYVATIYDQTTGTMVATRQFTIIDGRASAGSGRIWLQGIMDGNEAASAPYYVSFNGPYPSSGCGTVANDETGPSGAYSSTRIAWNGTETNVHDTDYTGIILCIGASNLASTTDTYKVVVTDPSGTVAYEDSIGAQPSSASLCSGAGNCIPPQYVEWSVPSQTARPFEQAFSGSTWTATVYDTNLGKVVAQQSFQFLGYTTSWAFASPAESTTLDIPTGNTSQATSLLLTNTSDLTFGTNNGDSVVGFYGVWVNPQIKSMSIQGPSQATACTVTVGTTGSCVATYSDSSGNAWQVLLLMIGSSDFFIEVTDSGGVPLKPGQTITISGLTVTTPTATTCTGSTCEIVTTAVPAHLIDAGQESTGGQVSNAFFVVNGSGSDSATATVGLAGYYNSSGTWEPISSSGYTNFGYTPRCGITSANCTTAGQSHAILSLNQPFTGAISKVVLDYTLTNTSSSDQLVEFDIVPPAAFSVTSASVDSHGAGWTLNPQGAGNCGSVTVSAICIKPTTALAAGSSANYYIALTPPSSSFSYSDLIGTIIYTQTGNQLSIPITPTTNSVATFIGSPTTIDSTAIGAYSFNGGLMTAGVTPSSVGTGTVNSLNLSLRNTTSGADPFPDEIDMVAVQFPTQSYFTVPTSCANVTTVTSGWSCELVTTAAGTTTFYFGQCPQSVANPVPVVPTSGTTFGTDILAVCPFSLPNEPYSLTAGATFTATIPVTAGSTVTGTPVQVSSFGHGATTDAWSTPIYTSVSVVNTPAAGAGFSQITGPGGVATATTTGNEPSITGDYLGSSPNYYDTYQYTIKNTGSTNITSVNITIPSTDTTGSNGADPSGTIWNVLTSPAASVSLTGCTIGTIVNPTSGTGSTGTIPITCPAGDFPAGATMVVTFSAKSPLKVNATYAFPVAIANGATAGNVTGNWTDDEDILVALSATVSVSVNPSMTCGGTATPGSGYPSASTTTDIVNFGTVAANTYEYCKDAMVVAVTTDASTPTNWSLYVSASGNPAASTAGGASPATASSNGAGGTENTSNELLVSTDTTNSTGGTTNVPAANIPCSTTSCFSYDNTTYAAVALTSSGTGTRLGYTTNGGTNVNNSTVQFDVNFQVALGTEFTSGVEPCPTYCGTGVQETITYTWIAN